YFRSLYCTHEGYVVLVTLNIEAVTHVHTQVQWSRYRTYIRCEKWHAKNRQCITICDEQSHANQSNAENCTEAFEMSVNHTLRCTLYKLRSWYIDKSMAYQIICPLKTNIRLTIIVISKHVQYQYGINY